MVNGGQTDNPNSDFNVTDRAGIPPNTQAGADL
jgi:hypothetical protein